MAKQLDAAVAAYHRRPLVVHYPVLVLDGVVLKRKTGVGAQKRVVLVALGIRLDGKREGLDFPQARAESQAEWEGFLSDLSDRVRRADQAAQRFVTRWQGLIQPPSGV